MGAFFYSFSTKNLYFLCLFEKKFIEILESLKVKFLFFYDHGSNHVLTTDHRVHRPEMVTFFPTLSHDGIYGPAC
jgi:hypothetical protein